MKMRTFKCVGKLPCVFLSRVEDKKYGVVLRGSIQTGTEFHLNKNMTRNYLQKFQDKMRFSEIILLSFYEFTGFMKLLYSCLFIFYLIL